MGRSCQNRALRPSVVFPDFCALQVMRARDLPYAYTFFCSRSCCWPFQCPQGTLSRSGHCELRGSRSSGEAWESWGADAGFWLCRPGMRYRRPRACQNRINSFLAVALRCKFAMRAYLFRVLILFFLIKKLLEAICTLILQTAAQYVCVTTFVVTATS